MLTWKEKNLDYEIETSESEVQGIADALNLKRKEPRLRDWNKEIYRWKRIEFRPLKRKEPRLRDWNARVHAAGWPHAVPPWKEKNLDYEIETLGV